MRSSALLAVASLSLAVAPAAGASPRHRPPYGGGPVDREGFLIGFSGGAGVIAPVPPDAMSVILSCKNWPRRFGSNRVRFEASVFVT